ncbi:MAG TPA: CocE/NonD family hydrolase [Thermoleophilaceae bacterium]
MQGKGFAAALVAVLALALVPQASAATVSKCNVPIEMSDGTTLYANVWLPSDSGRFPTLLQTTGYNKDVFYGGNCMPPDSALVDAGYAEILLDDRGTGASEGRWDSWGERTQQDYSEVLDWLQRQPWWNGHAATFGASYMAITSLLTAEADAKRVADGKPRAIDAIWADVPMADAYRDVTFHGGAVDSGFMPFWLGLTTTLSDIPPSTIFSDPASALATYAGHLANSFDFAARKLLEVSLGEDAAYDSDFYRLRSPVERIKSLKIPVAWTGGWWDIFQRGEPLLFEQMTNSPNKHFWMSPGYHIATGGTNWDAQGIGSKEEVMTRWFDRWLRGDRNGVDSLPRVNLFTMGRDQWRHDGTWPLPGTKYTPFYLGDNKSLSPAPATTPGADTAPLMPASSPCSRLTSQWTAGLAPGGPCETDGRTFEATALTYTTPPLEKDTEVTGLISADLFAELNGATDATLVAVLSDVDPSGASNQITSGFLLASQRALDRSKSTFGPGGVMIRPYHPFTKGSQQPVTPNDPTEYRIEIYPTSNVFKAGHRIRLTIATANTPGTLTPLPDTLNELGGQIRLLHGPAYKSSVQLPLAPAP